MGKTGGRFMAKVTFNEDISGYKIRFLENNILLITNDLDSKIIEITT